MHKLQISLLALALVTTPVWGQCAPNPLTSLASTWNFSFQGGLNANSGHFPTVIAGQFSAQPTSGVAGLLRITATLSAWRAFDQPMHDIFSRQETGSGRYLLNDDCRSGVLFMNLGSKPMQYEFTVAPGGRTLVLVSTTATEHGTGQAVPGAGGCPPGVAGNPGLLAGPFAFRARGETPGHTYSIAGRFTARDGRLDITATSVPGDFSQSVTRLERDAGNYVINGDCTGGTLFMNLSSRPVRFQFYFREGFESLDLIAISELKERTFDFRNASLGVAHRAPASGCPTNPPSLLTGFGAWTFNAQVMTKSVFRDADFALAGRFVPVPGGTLNIEATSAWASPFSVGVTQVARHQAGAGNFQLFDDCTGGSLRMNLATVGAHYDFWFYDGGRSMFIVSATEGRALNGSAHVAPVGCPVGGVVLPQTLLAGPYVISAQRLPSYTTESYAMAGVLESSATGALRLNVTSTVGNWGSVARGETGGGVYSVNANCTGGWMILHLGSRRAQYEFYFRAGFQTLDLIATDGPAAYGVVRRE